MDCYYGTRVEENSYQPKFCVVYDRMGNIIGCEDSSGAMMDHMPHPEEILFDLLRVIHSINLKAPLSDIMDDFRSGLKYQILFNEPMIEFEDVGLQDKIEDDVNLGDSLELMLRKRLRSP